jgi:hypothetical protein
MSQSTITNGYSVTTITLSIQNYGANNRSFNLNERVYLRKIRLVDAQIDAQRNAYAVELDTDVLFKSVLFNNTPDIFRRL